MHSKILIAALSFISCSVIADVQTLAHETNKNREVTVQNIGDSACTLNYKNGNYLTNEGFPVFYNFQAELNNGEIKTGMQSWLPHGMKANKVTTLSFHNENNGKIYEYREKASKHGNLFYNTDLFTRFLDAEKVFIRQGRTVKEMPVYTRADIPEKVKNSFQHCLKKLDQALNEFCLSSSDASKLCIVKKADAKKGYPNEVIKDDPKIIAALKAAKAAKAEAAEIAAAEKAVKAAEKVAKAAIIAAAAKVAEAAQIAQAAKEAEIIQAAQVAKAAQVALVLSGIAADEREEKVKKILTIYADKVEPPFHLNKFVQYDRLIVSQVSDVDHGQVTRIKFYTDKGIAFFETVNGENYAEYDYLEFDLKVKFDPRKKGGLVIKMDCFYPCSSGDYVIKKPQEDSWAHYKIKLADLINQSGSTLDITNVNIPFAILPDWGKQRGVVLMVDNISLTN
ncbi:MAG: hypothetical protein ACJAT7_001232 [Psychromonas sp.]|jgi:hypothetical protein|uniref:hypothetical protein n=1 Tax=Psychromonas sp. TaxID=1884585 RepID=UPI0039E56756